jgi:hypothetical protein
MAALGFAPVAWVAAGPRVLRRQVAAVESLQKKRVEPSQGAESSGRRLNRRKLDRRLNRSGWVAARIGKHSNSSPRAPGGQGHGVVEHLRLVLHGRCPS